MIDPDRLDELETLMPEGLPDDARVSLPACDLRDLVALIPVVRAAFHSTDYDDPWRLRDAVDELRKWRAG